MCNRCIAVSGIPRSLPSVFFMVHLPQNGVVFLQFRLTSKSLPHSKCHVILLIDVIGFNLHNRCDSHMDDRRKLIMFNSCDTGQNRCHMTATAIPMAMTISSIKRRVRGLTKPQVTSILRLPSGTLSRLYSLHVT